MRIQPVTKPGSGRVIVETCSVTGKVAIAMVLWRSADIDIPYNDDFSMFLLNQRPNTFAQHMMKVHLERKSRVRGLVRTVDINQNE